jgi:hypothetical protein
MFRSQKNENIMKNMESFDSKPSEMDTSSLVGIDAKIPGGKYDSNNTTTEEVVNDSTLN